MPEFSPYPKGVVPRFTYATRVSSPLRTLFASAALSVAVLILSAGLGWAASIPDPAHSTCPSTVFVGPSGCCFDVIVRDLINNPVGGSVVKVDFSSCGSVSLCAIQPPGMTVGTNYVTVTTDGSGVAHFCINGSISPCTVTITASSVVLCTVPAQSCGTSLCSVGVPMTMSYQGVLTDDSGSLSPDGSYDFTFRIYDDENTLLWTENQNGIFVRRGGFSVILGLGTPPVPLLLPFNRQYYLGIAVAPAPNAPGAELTPRVTLASSPYSLIARTVADGAVTGASIAAGQVVKSLNGLHDNVILAAGTNVNITPVGQTLTISAGVGGGLSGSGTATYVARFYGATTLENSAIFDLETQDGIFVGIGTSSPGATLEVNGTTKLGSGAPSIKMLKVTGTTSASDGTYVFIPTGIPTDNILSVSLLVSYPNPGGTWVAPFDTAANDQYTWYLELNGQIAVGMVAGHSSAIHSRPIKALVTYEE